MRHIDVFNGDADGICALHQLRLAEPADAELVTGFKRDIELVCRVNARPEDRVTILDVSLERNRQALLELLGQGAQVRYFDHHSARDVPAHRALEAVIDDSPEVCTSILIDRHLRGQFRIWAIVGAFGDGLGASASRLASTLRLSLEQEEALRNIGESLNYNAYGESESDVLLSPLDLYRLVRRYEDPFRLLHEEPLLQNLADRRNLELRQALSVQAYKASSTWDAYLLPEEPWSRRVSGTFANHLAALHPDRAHAVLTRNARGGYRVSVRTPRQWDSSAAEICGRFATGGGRRHAAGINHLEPARLDEFLTALDQSQ